MAGSSLAAGLPSKSSQPYLATIAPLPLRFAPPPPDLSTDPAPAAPPNPDGILGDVAQSNQEAVAPEPVPEVPENAPAQHDAAPPATTEPAQEEVPAPATRPPVAILPDDLTPMVRPEDLMPYFLPPQVPSAPPSQAIYRQQ